MDFELSLLSETVEAAYPTEPLVVTPDTSVRDVVLLMKTQKVSSVLVCDEGALRGIFTERDALKQMASNGAWDAPVEEVMVDNVATIRSDDTVGNAIRKMSQGGHRRLPIVDQEGEPVGVAGARGIVHYLVDHFPESIYNLPPKPGSGPSDREGA